MDFVFCDVANWQPMEKVKCGCTTTNLALSNGIKIISIFQCLQGEVVHIIFVILKHDGKTNKQTKKQILHFWPPGGG